MKTIPKFTSALLAMLTLSGCTTSEPKSNEARIAELERKLRFAESRLSHSEGRIRELDDGHNPQPQATTGRLIDTEVKILAVQRRINHVESRLKTLNDIQAKLSVMDTQLSALEDCIICAKSDSKCSTNNVPAIAADKYPIIADRLNRIELRLKTLESVDLLKTLDIPAPVLPRPDTSSGTTLSTSTSVSYPAYSESKPALP